ncbi:MAG TPA: tol-pal system protein YbgF [Alphaproteobacteria bacterium]|nr:tol-pal system protein YbgF [Alphaproteobacteria bacterium]
MRLTALIVTLAFTAPLLGFPGLAGAQSSAELSNRLNRLENELQTMSRAVYKGEAPPAGSFSSSGASADAAESLVRVQELESQIQALTGKIEEQGFEITQLKGQIDRMKADYDMRIQDLEAGKSGGMGGQLNPSGYSDVAPPSTGTGGPTYQAPDSSASSSGTGYQFSTGGSVGADTSVSSESSGSTPPQPSPLGVLSQDASGQPTGTSGDSVAAAYENAFSLLKAGNYEASGREFEAFLQKNPDHVLSGNAKYWLGETYYVRGDYEKSSRIFAEAYQKYPDGAKAADNLLKLGLSLAATGNNKDACVALRQLEKDYQNGAGPVLRRAQQEMSKLGC